MGYDATLVALIRATLAAAGDPERAAGQQAYLRSALPFHGITSPELRRLVNPLLRQACPLGPTDLGVDRP